MSGDGSMSTNAQRSALNPASQPSGARSTGRSVLLRTPGAAVPRPTPPPEQALPARAAYLRKAAARREAEAVRLRRSAAEMDEQWASHGPGRSRGQRRGGVGMTRADGDRGT